MLRLLYDVESDGLLETITKIHCLVTINLDDTSDVRRYHGDTLEEGLKYLEEADELVGHNIISFDNRAIKKLYPWWKPKAKITDTLVLARLIFSNVAVTDMKRVASGKLKDFLVWDAKKKTLVSAIGRHSLAAWGQRLGELKGDFGHETDWKMFTLEMLEYCVQDCMVTLKLYQLLISKEYSQDAINLEMQTQEIICRQEAVGVGFDEHKAKLLYAVLMGHRHRMNQKLAEEFLGWYEPMKTPEYYEVGLRGNTFKGATKGEVLKSAYDATRGWLPKPTKVSIAALITEGPVKQKHTPFNPNSRGHIYRVFKEKYNWEPIEWNEDGSPKVSEEILEALEYPEAKVLSESLMVAKRIGQIAEGEQNWLDACVNGRIYGRLNTLGAGTHRATHNSPNISQTPSPKKTLEHPNGKPYGKECRELFVARKGYTFVGSDAESQEIRCLAHYMEPYDQGAYGRAAVLGDKALGTDVHTLNMRAAGLPARETAKTWFYAWLYGAGNLKLGRIAKTDEKGGGKLKRNFLKGMPALKALKDSVVAFATEHGYIIGLDGRKIYIRSPHSALNALLQSCGAILTKRWFCFVDELLKEAGIGAFVDQVLWVHDEILLEVKLGYEQQVMDICSKAMDMTEEYYSFRCKLGAGTAVGNTWYAVH